MRNIVIWAIIVIIFLGELSTHTEEFVSYASSRPYINLYNRFFLDYITDLDSKNELLVSNELHSSLWRRKHIVPSLSSAHLFKTIFFYINKYKTAAFITILFLSYNLLTFIMPFFFDIFTDSNKKKSNSGSTVTFFFYKNYFKFISNPHNRHLNRFVDVSIFLKNKEIDLKRVNKLDIEPLKKENNVKGV